MSKASLFQNLLESKYPKRDYYKGAAEYAEKKKERNRQIRNAKRELSEGKATVVPAPLAKDKKAEAHIRSVNKYNKARDEQVDAWLKEFKHGEEVLENGAEADGMSLLANLKQAADELREINYEKQELAKDRKIPREEYEAANKKWREASDALRNAKAEMAAKDNDAARLVTDFNDINAGRFDDKLTELHNAAEPLQLPYQVRFNLPSITGMSPQDNITRYHTTKMTNLPGIYVEGLLTGKGGEGFGELLKCQGADADELGEVYTTSRAPFGASSHTYTPWEDLVTLQLEIPKSEYRKLGRNETNPEEYYSPDWSSGHGELLETIQNGGRTDIFQDDLKPSYIKGGYTEDEEFNTIEDLIKNYDCGKYDNCEDWYDALERNGLVDYYYQWNEPLFEKLRRRK